MSDATNGEAGAKFDAYAKEYQALHGASVAASGEAPDYFHRYKIDCLVERLGFRRADPMLDYGCGIGNLTSLLAESFDEVHGYDPSAESLRVARERAPRASFFERAEALPDGRYAGAVLSGVLHHVPPPERPALLGLVVRKLAPKGRLVVFEHNPINPLTRRAVAACPFDDDAVLLWPWQVRGLLRDAGLRDVRLDYVVFFPKPLSFLRSLEPRLARLALGAQTLSVGVAG
ncbi:MAG: class I SAM-dependent methyltransferase [Polyangiaceae bacterium]|jgi:SAM-dependent methyltransferase|nr:class I SAM-dependent methyltransferase [Polyangiaceae bacterium]